MSDSPSPWSVSKPAASASTARVSDSGPASWTHTLHRAADSRGSRQLARTLLSKAFQQIFRYRVPGGTPLEDRRHPISEFAAHLRHGAKRQLVSVDSRVQRLGGTALGSSFLSRARHRPRTVCAGALQAGVWPRAGTAQHTRSSVLATPASATRAEERERTPQSRARLASLPPPLAPPTRASCEPYS